VEYGSKTDMVGRSRTEVVMMMLETANNGSATITKIMHRTFLPHSVSKEFLTLLVERELLVHEKGNQTYITTEKGKRLLRLCNKMDGSE
jgi:predicted transcriptional regulator